MALGVIKSDEEFERELEKLNNKTPRAEVKDLVRGRGDKKEIPEELRKLIGEESLNGTSSKELQETFNVSPSSVAAYKNGATSTATYDKPDTDLKLHVDAVRDKITTRASSKLLKVLNLLTVEKVATAETPREISSIAKDLSAIIKNVRPEKIGDAPRVNFILYAPQQKPESAYEVIHVDN